MSNCLSLDEKALLLRIANNDESAFRLLFNQYHPKLYSQAIHILRSETLAEDIVQEVFAKVWEKRGQLAEINYINAWLKTITRNICCDYLRRLAIEKLFIEQLGLCRTEHVSSINIYLLEKEQKRILDHAILLLSPQQQRVYLLSNRYDMKQTEIARQLNISLHTVKEYKKLAMKFIRSYVQKRINVGIALFFFSQI